MSSITFSLFLSALYLRNHQLTGFSETSIMSHARVEELSDDSDPEMDDISTLPVRSGNPALKPGPSIPMRAPAQPPQLPAGHKKWHILYPIYFDAGVSRDHGRRVSKELAVPNPLAQVIFTAVQYQGLRTNFEPGKRHPKDWANPGRVRVELRDESGKWMARSIKNKHHLYRIIAEWLRQNPTAADDPLKLPIRGLPMPEGDLEPPPKPRGWHINDIIPLHSAAMTGGGVSENMLKDFQAAMQEQDPTVVSPSSTAEGASKKKKKDKGKKK